MPASLWERREGRREGERREGGGREEVREGRKETDEEK